MSGDKRLNPDRHQRFGYMASMGIMVAGFVSVDAITNNMIPITARHFTDSPLFISILIALNRLFGFLVQPYVAWKSDHITTRFGRRRPFLIIGLPGTCLALLLLGIMPFVFEGESRAALGTLVLLLLMNVMLQFFQDINWGAQEPLYADTFPQKRLGRATAIRSYAIQCVFLFMNYFAMKWADTNEFIPYLCAAVLVLISLGVVVFVVREKDFAPPVAKERYNPVTHIGLLFKNSDYLKVSIIGALGLMLPAAFYLFHSLFVTRTLGLTKAQLGETLAPSPIIAFAVSYPIGYLIDRYGPKWVLAFGFLVLAAISWVMGYWINGFVGLFIVMCVHGAALVLVGLPMTSMVFQYSSEKERGTIFGLIQFVRGLSAFAFSILIGGVVQWSASGDPTLIFPEDIRRPEAMAERIAAREDPVSNFLHENASPEVIAALADPATAGLDTAGVRAQLAASMNAVLTDPNLYAAHRFEDVKLSRQTRRFIREGVRDEDDQIVFNRNLLEDAFAGELSRQPDYRLSYLLSVVIALIGAAVTLSTRKGPYSQTIREDSERLD